MKHPDFRGELYFHIITNKNRKFGWGNREKRIAEPGVEYKALAPYVNEGYLRADVMAYEKQQPTLCEWGMHATKNGLWSTLWHGSWVCLVRLSGKVVHGHDKSVALRRFIVAMRQVTSGNQGTTLHYSSDQEIVDWVLAKPYKGIVAKYRSGG